MQPLTIRRALPTEAQRLAELGQTTFVEAFAEQNRPEDMALYLQQAFGVAQQTQELADPRTTFLLLLHDETPIGYAKLMDHAVPACVTGPHPLEIARFYLLQAWVGRGVASHLMQACVDRAVGLGYETLWLGVWEHNLRAQAFYRKWNFVVVGEHGFLVGSDLQRDLLMACSVPPLYNQTVLDGHNNY